MFVTLFFHFLLCSYDWSCVPANLTSLTLVTSSLLVLWKDWFLIGVPVFPEQFRPTFNLLRLYKAQKLHLWLVEMRGGGCKVQTYNWRHSSCSVKIVFKVKFVAILLKFVSQNVVDTYLGRYLNMCRKKFYH